MRKNVERKKEKEIRMKKVKVMSMDKMALG